MKKLNKIINVEMIKKDNLLKFWIEYKQSINWINFCFYLLVFNVCTILINFTMLNFLLLNICMLGITFSVYIEHKNLTKYNNKNIKKNNNMIGELRIIPKGVKVWSTVLKTNISFYDDMIVEITNTCIGNDNVVFGKLKIRMFHSLLFIYELIDRSGSDGIISFDLSETLIYEEPK